MSYIMYEMIMKHFPTKILETNSSILMLFLSPYFIELS